MARLVAKIKGKMVGVICYYRIGDIKLSMNAENPSTVYGGTWELIAKGTTLAGIDRLDTDTNTKTSFNQNAGTIIGSKYLQSHTHHWHGVNDGAAMDHLMGHYPIRIYQDKYPNWGGTPGDIFSTGSGDGQNIQPTTLCYIWMKTAN